MALAPKRLDDAKTPQEVAAWFDENPLPVVQLNLKNPGRLPGRIGFVMNLYFKEQRALDQRERMMGLVRKFREWVGPEQLQWWGSTMTGRIHFERNKKFDADELWKKGMNPNLEFGVSMSSVDFRGETVQTVEESSQRFYFGIYADPMNTGTGYMRINLPVSWALRLPSSDSLAAFFKRCAEDLRVNFGEFGLGICLPSETLAKHSHRYSYPISASVRQLPGLIAEKPGANTYHRRMGSINWMTAVHDDWLVNIGGREALKAQSKVPIGVIEYRSGLIFQAGPEPILSIIHVEPYRAVARLLKPLRMTNMESGSDVYKGPYSNQLMYSESNDPDVIYERTKYYEDSAWYLSRFD